MPFSFTTPPVKMRLERSAERDKREIKIILPLNMARAQAEAILNRPVSVSKSNKSAGTNRNVFQEVTHCDKEIEQILNMFQKRTQQAKK